MPGRPAPHSTAETPDLCDIPHSSQLRIWTFGRFRVLLPDGGPTRAPRWENAQMRRILAHLVATPGHRRSRDQLIELLWPGIDPALGSRMLNGVLSRLRRALEPDRTARGTSRYIASDAQTVSLNVETDGAAGDGRGPIWIDALVFGRMARAAMEAPAQDRHALELGRRALPLYCGAFLGPGAYDDWAMRRREYYHVLWTVLSKRVARTELLLGHCDQALVDLNALILGAPDDEDAVRLLMVAHAATGDRGSAVRAYDAFCRRLVASFDIPVSTSTTTLRDRILANAPVGALLALCS